MKVAKNQKLFLPAAWLILLSGILWFSGNQCLLGQTNISEASLRKLVRNFEYTLDIGSKYKLEDGHFEQGQSIENFVNIRLDSSAFGDLNDDGLLDAAVILVANYGGSGFFYELTALINDGAAFHQTNSLELGDRVKIEKLRIDQGKIIINMLTHGPNDPSCCPSKKAVLFFKLRNGQLSEIK